MTMNVSLQENPTARHDQVVDLLPRLRRHAYIVSGDRLQADDTVTACLRAYRSDPDRVRPHHARIDMFRLFHEVIGRPADLTRASSPRPAAMPPRLVVDNPTREGTPPALRALDCLSQVQRRLLALVAVEGFTVAEGARILDLSPTIAALHLAEARRLAALATRPDTDGRSGMGAGAPAPPPRDLKKA